MEVTVHSAQARLRVGDVFDFNQIPYVVDFINECRARCIPLARREVSYTTMMGKEVSFQTDYAAISISPNSEVEVTQRLGKGWRKKVSKLKRAI